jgi:hypothetical protein
MRHCFYIRHNYTDHAMFLKRAALMRETIIPSLAWQFIGGQSFDIQVLVGCEAHRIVIESLFNSYGLRVLCVRKFEFTGYDIQTRVDSDDILFPDFTRTIEGCYDGQARVVTFQMKKFAWDTGETYIYGNGAEYHAGRCSMFSSLLCPPEGVNIFSRKHGSLGELAPVTVIGADLCRLVVHNNNSLTRLGKNDKLEGAKGVLSSIEQGQG